MLKKLISKKDTMLFQYLLSYLAILILVMIVVGVISALTLKAVEKAAYTQSLAKMGRIQDSIDTHLRSAEAFALSLVTREDVMAIAAAQNELRPFHVYQAYSLIKELRRYEVANEAYAGVYLYFAGDDCVVNVTGIRDADEFFETAGYDMSFQEWAGMLSGQHFAEFKSFSGERGFAEYWFPIPGHSESFKTGVAVLRLREDTVNRMLGGLLWSEDETIAVLDGSRTLFQAGGTNRSLAEAWTPAHPSGGQFVSDDTVVSTALSGENGWTYLSALPRSYFIEQTRYLQSVVAFCILLAVAIIVVFAMLGLWKNYRPVRNIMGILRGRPEELSARDGKLSEYERIETSIRSILRNYDTTKKQLGLQKTAIQHSILSDLLNSRFEGIMSLDDTLNFYEIIFRGTWFAVYILYEQENADGYPAVKEEASSARMNNVVRDLLRAEGFDAYTLEERSFAVGLVCLRPAGESESETEELKRLVERGVNLIRDRYSAKLAVALGEAREGLRGISLSYREAAAVIDYLGFLGKTEEIVCEYAGLRERDTEDACRPGRLSTLNQLSNLIATRSFLQARTLFLAIIDDVMGKDCDVKMGKCLKYSMISAILEGLSALPAGSLDALEESPSDKILSCDSIAMLRAVTERMLEELDAYYKSGEDTRSCHDIIPDILRYIEENCGDYDLSVSQIADTFCLKVPFLSKLFKKQVGIGLLDYITTLRLARIKALLLSSDKNLNDIAKETGYINASALIRTFKRYEGVTPGKYKDAYMEPKLC